MCSKIFVVIGPINKFGYTLLEQSIRYWLCCLFNIGFLLTMDFFVSFFFLLDREGKYYRLTNIVTRYNRIESSTINSQRIII